MQKIITMLAIMLVASAANSQSNDERIKLYNVAKTGLAIAGYDPVAYFTEAKAVKGNRNLAVLFEGLTYYFSSTENKEAFKKNPARYEPQYGGWCAYAMGSSGEKVEVDPETFKIKDGKLFLFYNKYFNNTLKSWNKDEANLQARADANWLKIIH